MTDTTSAAPSLLPCPFCGSKAVASINKSESLWSHDIVDWTRVHCTNDDCNAQTEPTCDGYEPSAIEVWNRRAPQPVAREPLTDEQFDVIEQKVWHRTVDKALPLSEYAKQLKCAIERSHGIGSADAR